MALRTFWTKKDPGFLSMEKLKPMYNMSFSFPWNLKRLFPWKCHFSIFENSNQIIFLLTTLSPSYSLSTKWVVKALRLMSCYLILIGHKHAILEDDKSLDGILMPFFCVISFQCHLLYLFLDVSYHSCTWYDILWCSCFYVFS